MKPRTEDNFLERLTPQLRRENGVQMGPCPDSELLSAFTEDQVSPFVRDAIGAHLTRCPKCHEIHERLGQFAKASVPAQDAEWINAEKRLDNWMGGFLRAQSDKTGSKLKVEPSTPVPRWKDISKAALSWKVGWALGMAAVLAFGVASVVLSRRGPAGSAPVQIAANHPSPPQDRLTNSAPPVSENSAQTNESKNGSANVSKSEKKPQSAISNIASSQESHLEASAKAANSGGPQAAPPSQSSGTNSAGTSQIAQTYSPPKPGANLELKQGAPMARGMRMSGASHPGAPIGGFRQVQTQPSSAPGPAAGAVADLPISLQLEAGTYLWIRLDRTLPEDGTFTFQGTLMPPVARSGTVLLNEETGINGAVTMKGGEVATIFVTEIVVQGVRYKLQDPAGATNMNAPGSGWALPFNEGKELEMHLPTASVYERAAGGGGSPGRMRSYAAAQKAAAAAHPTNKNGQAGPHPTNKNAQPPRPQN